MNEADRIRVSPCGCRYDVATGALTLRCATHEDARAVKEKASRDGQKHTPGPWQVRGSWVVIHTDPEPGQGIDIGVAHVVGNLGQPVEANAALIARAPQLAEALREVMKAVDEGAAFIPAHIGMKASAAIGGLE